MLTLLCVYPDSSTFPCRTLHRSFKELLVTFTAEWLPSAKVEETQTRMAGTQECRRDEAHELWYNKPVGSLFVTFSSETSSITSLPLSPVPVLACPHALLPDFFSLPSYCAFMCAFACPFLHGLGLLSLCFLGWKPGSRTTNIWFLPENPIQSSFGHSRSGDVLQGHPEDSVSLSFVSVRSTLLARKRCSAALYLS